MDDQTQYEPESKPKLKLSSKAIVSEVVAETNNIIYGLANNRFCLIDQEHGQKVYESEQIHLGRIGCLRSKDNLLITGGNDNTIKLFDTRNWQAIHSFQKIPSRFTSVDKSEHILAASTNSNIVFWDLKKMKQRSQFKQSFNGQVTCIRFQKEISTNLMGCSIDGMINMFDLTQPNQQQAFNWCYKIMEAPSVLSAGRNGSVVLRTVDHNIYKILDGDLIRKIVPNTPQTPKHVLYSDFRPKSNYQIYQYCLWLPEQKIVQFWSGQFLGKNHEDKCIGYLNDTQDVEILDVLYSNTGKAIGVYTDQQGNLYRKNFSTHRKSTQNGHQNKIMSQHFQLKGSQKRLHKQQKINNNGVVQQKFTNKNGYIIQKPPSSFSNQKKFKPY